MRSPPADLVPERLARALAEGWGATRLFRKRHRETPDTRWWFDGLVPLLEQLPSWLDLLG